MEITEDIKDIIRAKKAKGTSNTALMKLYNLNYYELRQILDAPIKTEEELNEYRNDR